jgi:hypothetical protein
LAKLTLATITSGYGSVDRLNANSDLIEEALENTLSRDGSSPNQMEANLDMNTNRILNLPAPENATEPLRLGDLSSGAGTLVSEIIANAAAAAASAADSLAYSEDAAAEVVNAAAQVTLATAQADAAAASATAAATAETNAETAQTAAETAKTAAETAETNAETAETAAEAALTTIQQLFLTVQTLTDGANIAWNLNSGRLAKVTLAGNRTLDTPTNISDGPCTLHVIQDGTGSRTLTWPATFKWPLGIAPTLSTAAGARDVFSFTVENSVFYGAQLKGMA